MGWVFAAIGAYFLFGRNRASNPAEQGGERPAVASEVVAGAEGEIPGDRATVPVAEQQ
ncbi:MAG: hypothetical protein SangKO_031840 [Sandaracinaceae bacterium]